MIHVNIEGERYTITRPKITLVLTKEEFLSSLHHGKRWRRRKIQLEREAQASLAAAEKRGQRA